MTDSNEVGRMFHNIWSGEDTLLLMNVTPCPGCRRQRAHDRMLRRLEMFGRVFSRRGIAAVDMAAGLTLAKSDPNGSFRQALPASPRGSLWRKITAG
jgi:hypothetical protein